MDIWHILINSHFVGLDTSILWVSQFSEKVGLKLNIQKMKIMENSTTWWKEKQTGSQQDRNPSPNRAILYESSPFKLSFLFCIFKWRIWIKAGFSDLNYSAYLAKYFRFSIMDHK